MRARLLTEDSALSEDDLRSEAAKATRRALETLLGSSIRFDEPLSRHTSLRVGGPADALARPKDLATLREVARLCRSAGLPVFALGRGFNTLVRDEGCSGVVIQLSDWREIEPLEPDRVRAQAGVTHTSLTRYCAKAELSGLEFGIGIPGTIGGWIAMNAGIPAREMKDLVETVEIFDPVSAQARILKGAELEWSYRRLALPESALILAATFRLSPSKRERISAEMQSHLDQRRATQPVNEPSCGSVFKNPPSDRAGRLIEAAGLKGSQAGHAEISQKHANFIVTREGAHAADVLELIARARTAVSEQFSVELETEVVIRGRPAGREGDGSA